MAYKYFRTDGIRGQANTFPMTAETALRIGMAVGSHFRVNDKNNHRVVIGKDTRRSGYMLENALTAGLAAMGMNVLLLGPIPTPAIGLLTRSMRADLGLMITASHNTHEDNGFKLFGPDGFKLSQSEERKIESLIDSHLNLVGPSEIGSAKRIDGVLGRYVEFVKTTVPKNLRLDGLRIVIDCANGAGYKVAPEILWELGAEVVPLGVQPNGLNINDNCGSTHPQSLINKMKETRSDLGIALDGDADRVLMCDEKGIVIDGDQILALLAKDKSKNKTLKKATVVATVMSNLGLERFLASADIKLARTQVGDRFVTEKMVKEGYNLGGEQSGHIILSDYTTTGDGLICALQFLAILVKSQKKASELSRVFSPVPQILKNYRVGVGVDPLAQENVQLAVDKAKEKLKGCGRVLVRNSGTEPLARVMVEGDDLSIIEAIAEEIGHEILKAN